MDAEEKIQRWIDGLAQFDLWQSVCDFYKENERQFIQMIQAQLTQCLDPYGQMIFGVKNPADLYYEGGFYRGMYIKTDDEQIEFTSTDQKWEHQVPPSPGYDITMTPIKEVWGQDVIGIPEQEQNMVDLATSDYVSDAFRKIFD